ncbi:MAG: acyltransferase [Gammaproteobacteria bacterium]|nr:acyltransferase [Gammaproteobacteria bacterium]
MNYRPDIDGLRAIAVLSVLFYHLDNSLLPGGFVGVDVFFVISGYLITKLIATEITANGDFSFKRFYIRRVRRLFPAMCATFVFCLILSGVWLSPQHLTDFGYSLIYAVLSVSNFFFWDSVGYFDAGSEFKPLLHTWSLSVEEQFYLIWPLTLFLLIRFFRRSVLITTICITALLSLLANHLLFENQLLVRSWFAVEDNQSTLDIHATAFYLLPFRVFEFAAGAILVFVKTPDADRGKFNHAQQSGVFILGLGLIIYSLIFFNGKMEFPSFAGLVPCVGAALMIAAGPNHALAQLVSNRFMAGIGLISYSLYLIHWPLIVFYKYPDKEQVEWPAMTVLVVGSMVLAVLMYRFIEQPFRRPAGPPASKASFSNRPFLLISGLMAILLVSIALNAVTSKGWLWRYPPNLVQQLAYSREDYADFFWEHITAYEKEFENNGKPKVVIIGDSMAADLINALVEGDAVEPLDLVALKVGDNCKAILGLPYHKYFLYFGGKQDICYQEHQKIMAQRDLIATADAVIIATFFLDENFLKPVRGSAAYIQSLGVPRVLMLLQKSQISDGMSFLAQHAYDPNIKNIRTPLHPNTEHINTLLRSASDQDGFELISLLPNFCDNSGCQRVTDNGDLMIFDGVHLTQAGARYIGKQLVQQVWYQNLLGDAADTKSQTTPN